MLLLTHEKQLANERTNERTNERPRQGVRSLFVGCCWLVCCWSGALSADATLWREGRTEHGRKKVRPNVRSFVQKLLRVVVLSAAAAAAAAIFNEVLCW